MDNHRSGGASELGGVLEDVARRYEEIWHENAELRERVAELEGELAAYRKLDQQLREAVVVACNAGGDARLLAEERLEAARLDAEDILRAAEERRRALEAEIALRETVAKEPGAGYRNLLTAAFERFGLDATGVSRNGDTDEAPDRREVMEDRLEP